MDAPSRTGSTVGRLKGFQKVSARFSRSRLLNNWVPDDIFAAAYSTPLVSDPCLSQGGLDQNIYGTGG
jgi:hypothetical protein